MTDPLFDFFRAQREGKSLSGADRCRRIPVPRASFAPGLSFQERLSFHSAAMGAWGEVRAENALARPHLLDLKASLARDLLSPCRLCWRECEVDRLQGELGDCLLGPEIRCYNEFIHYGEEVEITPTHALFLSGCNFRCRFCSDWSHVAQVSKDPVITPEALAERIALRQEQGCQTLSLIGGTPDVSLPGILEALCQLDRSLPLVWNSNMTWSEACAPLLEGLVDAYIADWKFGNDPCAKRIADVENHEELVPPRILNVCTETFTIVRHLVMPGHIDCCTRPVLKQIQDKAPTLRLNLMDQYQSVPVTRALGDDPLAKSLNSQDFDRAKRIAEDLGLSLLSREPERSFEILEERGAEAELAFESKITITESGELVIENLDASMIDLAQQIAPNDQSLQKRFKLQSKGPIKEHDGEEKRSRSSCSEHEKESPE